MSTKQKIEAAQNLAREAWRPFHVEFYSLNPTVGVAVHTESGRIERFDDPDGDMQAACIRAVAASPLFQAHVRTHRGARKLVHKSTGR